MQSNVLIIEGKSEAALGQISTGTVDLVVTSPPYDNMRSYNGHADWDFDVISEELLRVMSPGGIVCWNVGDSVVDGSETLTSARQKIRFRAIGFRIHDTMIYEKNNFANPSFNRYHQTFEYIFVLTKGAPRVFNPIKDKPNKWAGHPGTFGRNTIRESDGGKGERPRIIVGECGMRGNVWRGKTRGQEEICDGVIHEAMMPRWLARDLIWSFSNKGDTVLDPFGGSGTTGIEAVRLGRKAVLIDSNPAYVAVMRHELPQHHCLI